MMMIFFLFFTPVLIFPDYSPVLTVRVANGSYQFLMSEDVFTFSQTIFHLFR